MTISGFMSAFFEFTSFTESRQKNEGSFLRTVIAHNTRSVC